MAKHLYPDGLKFEDIGEILDRAARCLSSAESRTASKLPVDRVWQSLHECDLYLIKAKEKLSKMIKGLNYKPDKEVDNA